MTALCVAVSYGHARGGHPDHASQDYYQACNKPRAAQEAVRPDRQNSVFSVWVTRPGGAERTGTATLIDDTGIFVAAGHSVYWDKNHPIKVMQMLHGRIRTFNVTLLSSPDNFQKEDYVLLKAEPWENESRFPYPLRFDDVGLADAEFIGFEEMTKEPVPTEEPAHRGVTYYKEDESGRHYQGMIFGHSSGALLYDKFGRAFGIVIKHTPWNIDSLIGQPPETVAKSWNERAAISIFPLEKTLKVLKQNISASPFMEALIKELQSNIAPAKVPGDLNMQATPLDMILLIDEVVFGEIHQKWVTNIPAMTKLSQAVRAAADELCTSYYYLKAVARLMYMSAANGANSGDSQAPSNDNIKVADPPDSRKSGPGPATGKPAEEGIVDQLGADTSDAAAGLGVRFLESALAAPQSELARSQARLAVTLLRRAAADPGIQRARERGVTNREYAAIFANLALAEDLGIDYQIGSRIAAEIAIRAADALGGSPTAYQLDGRYAMEAGDAKRAAGLFERAFAMLSPRNPREQSIREELAKEVAVAQAAAVPLVVAADAIDFSRVEIKTTDLGNKTYMRRGEADCQKTTSAVGYYRRAADQGNAAGRNSLGRFYQFGRGGLPQSDQEAAHLYKLAADQGNAFGQANLGFFYETGRGGLAKDDQEAGPRAARDYRHSAASARDPSG
jgi:TPR repeat protein